MIQLVRVPSETHAVVLRRFRAACRELGVLQVERGTNTVLEIVSGSDVERQRVRQAWEAARAAPLSALTYAEVASDTAQRSGPWARRSRD